MNENREGDLFDGEGEILKELEEAYLTAYPNPDRIDCPSSVLIEQMVSGQIRPPARSGIVHHLTHCSPCFRIFLDARNNLRAARKRRSLAYRFAIASVLALIAVTAGVLMRNGSVPGTGSVVGDQRKEQEQSDVASISLDLQGYSLERSESGSRSASHVVRPTLPRKRVQLNLALPVGFEDGIYEIRISRAEEEPALMTSRGSARLINRILRLETILDLTGLSPGTYFLGMRQPGTSWAHVQIIVK